MKKYVKYVDLVMAALAVVALIMLFLPAVEYSKSYNGLKVVFGYTEKSSLGGLQISSEVFGFSFMNLLTYLLVIGSAVCAVLSYAKKNKVALLVAIVLAIVSAVFFLLTKNFVVIPDGAKKVFEVANTSFAKESKLLAGPIIGAVCMFLSAIAGVVKLVLGKK